MDLTSFRYKNLLPLVVSPAVLVGRILPERFPLKFLALNPIPPPPPMLMHDWLRFPSPFSNSHVPICPRSDLIYYWCYQERQVVVVPLFPLQIRLPRPPAVASHQVDLS